MIEFKKSSIPFYYQLETILREKIKSGEYNPGDPFPSETQLVSSYKLSRITVRKSLDSLERDGLIDRIRGKGSFVKEGKAQLEPMKLTGMMEDIYDIMGVKTKMKVVSFGFFPAIKTVAKNLELGENLNVLRVERIRLIEEAPFSYSQCYIPFYLGKRINKGDLSVHPMMSILERKCGVQIERGSQIIDATVADSRVASLLDVMVGSPLLKSERTVFDKQDRPVEFISILYRPDRYHYSVELVRKKKTQWHYQLRTSLK